MMEDEDTSIRIKRDTWDRLRQRKSPGDSFDDVINDVLDEVGREEVTA